MKTDDVLEDLQEKRRNKKIFLFAIIGIIAVVLAIFAILSYAYFTGNKIPPANLTNNDSGTNHPDNNLPAPNTTGLNGITPVTNKTTNQTKPKPSGGSSGGNSGGTTLPACTPDCSGKQCGDNGCGQSCGACNASDYCNATGQCIMTPPSCTNDYGCTGVGSFCDYNTPYTCSSGGDGCLDRINRTRCGSGEICDSGICKEVHAIFVDNQLTTDCLTGNYSVANRNCLGSDGNAYNTLQKAANNVSAGDTVYIRNGTYPQGFITLASGYLNSPITYKNYPNELVIFDQSENGGSCIIIGDYYGKGNYTIIDGITCRNPGISGLYSRMAIAIYGASVTIKNCHIYKDNYEGFPGPMKNPNLYAVWGIMVRGSDALIENNYIHNLFIGIHTIDNPPLVSPDRVVVRWNHISNMYIDCEGNATCLGGTYSPNNAQGISFSKHTLNSTAEYNLVHDTGDEGITTDKTAGRHVWHDNIIYFVDNYNLGGNGQGIKTHVNMNVSDIPLDHTLIYNNIVFGNVGGIELNVYYTYGDIVVNNVVYANKGHGLWARGSLIDDLLKNHIVYDNLMLDNGQWGGGYMGIYYYTTNSTYLDYNYISDLVEKKSYYQSAIPPNNIHSLTGDPKIQDIDQLNLSLNANGTFDIPEVLLPLDSPEDYPNLFPEAFNATAHILYAQQKMKEIFSLQSDSPLIDAGKFIEGLHCPCAENNTSCKEPKFDGCREWYGTAPDIGAFEYKPASAQECTQDSDCTYRGPGFICNITSSRCEWKPPIGIPKPDFGIEESYRMYDSPANRNPALNYTKNEEGGFYTHYVDASDPNATDDNSNPYGTASKPRRTFPYPYPPYGSVIEIHNSMAENNYDHTTSLCAGVGTAVSPIFVRGVGMPRVPYTLDIGYGGEATYMIIEGISWHAGSISEVIGGGSDTTYISIRNCDFHGDENSGGVTIGPWESHHLDVINHIVFYNNVIHDNGIWDPDLATGDRGIGGLVIQSNLNNVWALDNLVYNNECSGISVIQGTSVLNTYPGVSHHIYIGRNVVHHNKEAGLWTKTARDVIFSENIAYGHRPSTSADGAGLGNQYDPKRVWYLYNIAFDNAVGIQTASMNGDRDEIYFIGNLVHDCPTGFQLNNLYSVTPAQLIGNTIYNTDKGIENSYYTSKLNIINNIIANSTHQIYFPSAYRTSANSNMSYNLLQGPINLLWEGSYTNLSQFHQATGQCLGCIEADPKFVDAANNNFNLQSNSPAVDRGISSGVVKEAFDRFEELYGIDIRKDIEGRARPLDGDNNGSAEWDIGAYEYSGGIGGASAQSEFNESLHSEKATLSFASQIYKFFKGFLTANTIKEITGYFLRIKA